MKTLYVARHAKSSWSQADQPDHERPLTEEGVRRAKKIIEFLKRRKPLPEFIVSSHAVRAYETAKMIALELGYPEEEISIQNKLYMNGPENIMNVVFSLPDEKKSTIIVGHNPCMTKFANNFLSNKIDSLPTAGLVCFEFDTDRWKGIPKAKKKVKFVIYPKDLG